MESNIMDYVKTFVLLAVFIILSVGCIVNIIRGRDERKERRRKAKEAKKQAKAEKKARRRAKFAKIMAPQEPFSVDSEDDEFLE